MSTRPTRPIEDYPVVPADQMPPVPPVPPAEPEVPAQGAVSAPAPAVAALDFQQPRVTSVHLKWPYSRPDGTIVTEITVRALTLAQMGDLGAADRLGDLYEIYGAMCGMPAAELRGLDADDGSEVVEAAYPFLPLLIRRAHRLS